MPSFLNKVFGYKKNEVARPTRDASDNGLLDGKYEAIPPVLSPSAFSFPEPQPTKDPDHDVGFSLLRPKSRAVSQKSARKQPETVPYLTLRLPGPKENADSRALGVVFEADPDSRTVIGDAAIAAKRLDPLEALVLVRLCAQVITERGLETLGIMRSHWFSASPDVQRKLISLFIRSLTPQPRITTLSPTPTSATSAFENELHYTRSPHDVAAVLRWGLRHLSLENGHFGKDSTEWYRAFFLAERNASYPPKAFSDLLLPQLPASHAELLTATLALISSLASHAESNSISGSRLSKLWGIWLLVTTRAEQSDDWSRFYARWERAGRILEHLFLARLREESLVQRLPTRLQELIQHYPYNKGSPAAEDELLSRPRFSTRRYDALLVRIETLLTHGAEQPKQHPIQLLLDAFQLPIENPSGDDRIAMWNTLKTTASEEAASSDSEGPQFARIFVDDTIQLLALIPAGNNVPTSPTLFTSPIPKAVSRKRSSSPTKPFESNAPRSNANSGSTPVSPTSPSSAVTTDWAQFSLAGFGDTPATQPLVPLLNEDDDTEVTQPQILHKSSRQRDISRTRRRRSEDREPLETPASPESKFEPSIVDTKLGSVRVVQIDEAFVDFWSDAIVDPISANWPTFVVCGLKQLPGAESLISWLVVEQTYNHQQPQPSRVPSPDGHRGRSPRPSLKSDISGFRINSMFSSARKRFSAFSKSATDLNAKKSGGKTPIAGELGEILVEEESTLPSTPPTKADHHFDGNAVVGASVTSVTASIADHLKVDDISAPPAGIPTTDIVPAFKEVSDRVAAATKAPSIERTPQSGGTHNGVSVQPRSSLRRSEDAVSVEQGSSRIIDTKANAADSVTKAGPLAADTLNSSSTQNPGDSAVSPSSGPAPTMDNHVVEELQLRQDVVDKAEDRFGKLVARPADGNGHLAADPSNVVQVNVTDNSRQVAEAVATPSAPETVAVLLTMPVVNGEASEHTAQEPHVAEQSSRKAPTEFAAASSTDESVVQYVIDDRLSVSAPDVHGKGTAIEMGAHLEPDPISSVADGDEEGAEVAGHVEVPTPAPGAFVALVQETAVPEHSVDPGACSWATQYPAAGPEALEDAAPQPVAAEFQTTLDMEEELAAHPVEESSVAIVSAVAVAAVETERAADRASELTAEGRYLVQDAIVRAAAKAPLVDSIPPPDVDAYVPAAQDVASAEVEAQVVPERFVSEVHIVRAQDTGAPTPVLENSTWVDDTPPGPEIATEAVEAALVVAPGSKAVEDEPADFLVEAIVLPSTESFPAEPSAEAEPPTQYVDTQPAESAREDEIAMLEGADEIVDLKAETHPTPTTLPTSESAPIKSVSERAQLAPSAAADPSELMVDRAAKPANEETQVLVEDDPAAVTPTVMGEEPVGRDVQVPIEIEASSNASAPQSVDVATNPSIAAASVPEEISSVTVDGPQEEEGVATTELAFEAPEGGVIDEDVRGAVDGGECGTRAAEPGLSVEDSTCVRAVEEAKAPVEVGGSEPKAAPAVKIDDETRGGANGPQEIADFAKPPVIAATDVPMHEPAGLSASAEP